jgi:hypothetical protein
LELNIRRKIAKCYIWSIAFCGAETLTLRKVEQKCQKIFEMWCLRRMEKISWTDRVRNEEVLHRVQEERNTYSKMKEDQSDWSRLAYELPSETRY